MSVLSVVRASLHPWVWWAVVKRAVESHTRGGDLSAASRRKAADFLKAFLSKFAPNGELPVVASPYGLVSPLERKLREARNAEILRDDPVYGMYVEDERDARGVVTKRGYNPVPKPALRETLDLLPAVRDYLVEAVEDFAKRQEVDNSLAPGLIDAIDGLKDAKSVDVDTERLGAITTEA